MLLTLITLQTFQTWYLTNHLSDIYTIQIYILLQSSIMYFDSYELLSNHWQILKETGPYTISGAPMANKPTLLQQLYGYFSSSCVWHDIWMATQQVHHNAQQQSSKQESPQHDSSILYLRCMYILVLVITKIRKIVDGSKAIIIKGERN